MVRILSIPNYRDQLIYCLMCMECETNAHIWRTEFSALACDTSNKMHRGYSYKKNTKKFDAHVKLTFQLNFFYNEH